MNEIWTIRKAVTSDSDTIAAFNTAMALETENKRLDPATVGPGVRCLMDQPAMGFYLVAERDGFVGGCLMVTFEWTDWRNGIFWWIQSVYVRPEHRRKGLFSALFHHVSDMARSDPDARGIRLYVEKDNAGARQTYQALGMDQTHYRMYEIDFSSETSG